MRQMSVYLFSISLREPISHLARYTLHLLTRTQHRKKIASYEIGATLYAIFSITRKGHLSIACPNFIAWRNFTHHWLVLSPWLLIYSVQHPHVDVPEEIAPLLHASRHPLLIAIWMSKKARIASLKSLIFLRSICVHANTVLRREIILVRLVRYLR